MMRIGDKVSFRRDLICRCKYEDMTLYENMVKEIGNQAWHTISSVNVSGDAFKISRDGYWYNKKMLDKHERGVYTVKLPINVWNDESGELETHKYVLWKCINSDETRLYNEEYEKIEHGYKWVKYMTMKEIKNIDERYVVFAEEV